MQDTAHLQIEELGHVINKGLEFWSLQVVADSAIMLSFVILVMEAAGEEYLKKQPDSWWPALQRTRSDFNPDLAMATFRWANPALVLVFFWAVVAGAVRSCRAVQQSKAGLNA